MRQTPRSTANWKYPAEMFHRDCAVGSQVIPFRRVDVTRGPSSMAAMTLSVSRPSRQMATSPTFRMDPSDLLDLVPIDIEETEDAYVVDLDLPNVGEDNVQIELRGSELRIFGEFRERTRHGILRRQSRRVGEFEYLISLPGDLDPDRVEASLEHGVLQVWAPKAQSAHPRRIDVHKSQKTPKPGTMAQPSAGQAGSSQAGAAQRSS